MNTHYHLLLLLDEASLSAGMRILQSRYAGAYNERYGRRGAVFAGRFRSTTVSVDAHLLAAAIYIGMNPVRAGLVSHPDQWPWSSFRVSAGLATTDFVDDRLLHACLSHDVESARLSFRRLADHAVAELKAEASRLDVVKRSTTAGVRPLGV